MEEILDPRDTALILRQAAKALHRAHVLGVVHRDIKPENIFLCDSDYELFVKVLDFGVAKKTWDPAGSTEVTKTGMMVGTPGYMAPEQAVCSKEIDHRADLWSLAALAYRALTGCEPYADHDGHDTPFCRMMRRDLTPPSALEPTLSPAIDAWFARALHADPDKRCASALELADSFAVAVSADQPIVDQLSRESVDEMCHSASCWPSDAGNDPSDQEDEAEPGSSSTEPRSAAAPRPVHKSFVPLRFIAAAALALVIAATVAALSLL